MSSHVCSLLNPQPSETLGALFAFLQHTRAETNRIVLDSLLDLSRSLSPTAGQKYEAAIRSTESVTSGFLPLVLQVSCVVGRLSWLRELRSNSSNMD